MSKYLMTVTAAALTLVLAGPVAAQDTPTADTVVATINGKDITLGHMLMIRASLPDQYQQLDNDVLWDGILDQVVQQEVLSQQDGATETRRVRVALENERRSLLAAEVIARIAEESLTDEAVQAAYDAQYAGADQGMEYNASHILVETEEEAQAIIDTINAGADFAETAKEKSTGPSGSNGGELGWFAAGMMVAEFQTAVETLEVGAVSAPVQTQFGWHVIKLNETRAKAAPALEAVRAEIEVTIQRTAVAEYIDSLVNGATITRTTKDDIDTSVLSQTDLLEE